MAKTKNSNKLAEKNETVTETPIVVQETKKEFEQSGGNYTPFDEAVKERAYTKPNVQITGTVEPIPEPYIKKPVINLSEEIKTNTEPSILSVKSDSQSGIHSASSSTPEISDADKKRSAETMVDMIVDAYSMINVGLGKLMQFSENDKIKLAEKVDLNTPLQVSPTNHVPLVNFIDSTNEEITKACSVDDDFKKKIKPPLTRIALKRGWGMTDEQEVLYIAVRDVGEKAAILYGIKSTMNMIVKNVIEQTEMMRGGIVPPPPPPAATDVQTDNTTSSTVDDANYEVMSSDTEVKSSRKPSGRPRNSAINDTLALEADEQD